MCDSVYWSLWFFNKAGIHTINNRPACGKVVIAQQSQGKFIEITEITRCV